MKADRLKKKPQVGLMGGVPCPPEVTHISEPMFWQAVRILRGRPETSILVRARRLGLAGEKEQAYTSLADYHRASLADEWQCQRDVVSATYRHTPAVRKITDDILRRRINTWHGTIVQFEREIDWDYANTDRSGFHYLFWLKPAVQRFIARREPRFRDDLMEIVLSYYKARNNLTPDGGVHHIVYYELGARAKSQVLLPLYMALLDSGQIPADVHEAFMKLFLGFGRALAAVQTGYRGGNWQLVGCAALLTLARLFPEFRESGIWERRAIRYLEEHIDKDFYADGGHHERCWGYGHMSLEGLADAYRMARRHGGLGDRDERFMTRIRQAYEWFAQTLGPNELKPAYGDCALGSGSSILDAAREFFPADTPRRLGVDAAASVILKPSQFAIMRNGNDSDSAYLNLSWGNISWWHSHMDTLCLNFWAMGQPLIEELGRFGSYEEPLTILFRAPESHNMLTVDGMHFDNVDHRNRMGRDPLWGSTPQFDFFSGWHRAYRAHALEPQALDITIRRTVVFVKDPGYALVVDAAWPDAGPTAAPAFSITQNWHSPFAFQTVGKDRVRTAGRAACLLAFAGAPRRMETVPDYTKAESGVSANVGQWPERHALRARQWMNAEYRGAIGIATVLYPFKGKMPAVKAIALPLPDAPAWRATAFEIQTPHGRDRIVLNPEKLPGLVFEGQPVEGFGTMYLGRRRGQMIGGSQNGH